MVSLIATLVRYTARVLNAIGISKIRGSSPTTPI